MTPELATSVISDVNKWLARKNGRYTIIDLNGEIISRIKSYHTRRGGSYGKLHFLKNRNIIATVSLDNKLKHISINYPYKDDVNTSAMVDAFNFNFKQVLDIEKPIFNFDTLKNFKF
jgi:hypothetical protein